MTDNDARAALAARQEEFDPLGPVVFVPLVRVKWRAEWRKLSWLPDYEISELGDVRRAVSFRNHPAGLVIKGALNRGYRYVQLKDGDGRSRKFFVARLVCEAWHGEPPSKEAQAAHGDGDRSNNHYSNLRWATPAENCRDKIAHGTYHYGELNPAAKLSTADVLQLRREFTGRYGETKALAKRFNVDRATIARALSGRSWSEAIDA